MSNTLTGLITVLYRSMNTVSRELTGLIPSVFMNADASQAAVGQEVKYPIAPQSTARDITPATNSPDDGDQTTGDDTIKITKSKAVPIRWTGEEIRSVDSMHAKLLEDQFTQGMRTLTNEVEADLAGLFVHASRAYGTPGDAPFKTAGDYTDASFVRKILVDNGAGTSDLQLVLDTTAGATMRGKQSQVQMTGNEQFQRQGVLLDMHGMSIRESAQIQYHTKGTGTGYVTSGATAAGVQDITLATGEGTVLAGDLVGFAADSAEKYIVGTGVTAPGTMSLNAPGARVIIPTGNAMSIQNSYRANMAFRRGAIHLVTRQPIMPEGGDAASMVFTITDPISGITYQVAVYREYRRIKYEIGLAWGVKAVKPAHMALLLG